MEGSTVQLFRKTRERTADVQTISGPSGCMTALVGTNSTVLLTSKLTKYCTPYTLVSHVTTHNPFVVVVVIQE